MRFARLFLGLPLQLPIPQCPVRSDREAWKRVRASRKVYTNFPNAHQPSMCSLAAQRPCRNATRAARLVGSVASQLHAVDNAGSG